MSKIIEPPLEENQIQLTSQHRLSIDKYNKTISFKYRKREGKGRNAEYSNEYGYNNDKHFSTFEYLSKRLLTLELDEFVVESLKDAEVKDLNKLVSILEKVNDHLDKVATEISDNLKEKVVINLEIKNKKRIVKGQVIDEDDGEEE